ncbi:MAG: hypothetical protein DRQ56_00165 [Gammaproteobacteria bacterium]|nr:MAG: hypothetical protein DRQ56_00165 [Gammaproteobacteria bacterium]
MKIVMRSALLLLLSWMTVSLAEAPTSLDQLLQQVRKMHSREATANRVRERQFLQERNAQKKLLAKARKEKNAAETLSIDLKRRFDGKEKALLELEDELREKTGVHGELFGVARQVAGDLSANLQTSLISSEYPGRLEALDQIANRKDLPTIEQLESLWFTLQQEMTESGKSVKFQAEVMSPSGEPEMKQVERLGLFNILADGRYLKYLPETGRLVELERQPPPHYLRLTKNLQNPEGERVEIAIDPTRGALLGMLVLAPDVSERVRQGGIIGYVIIALGIIGLILAIVRLVYLYRVNRKVNAQLADLSNPRDDNPLGRVLEVPQQLKTYDMETLESLLDEAILRETPKLESGQSLLKLFAAVAPLLGLLGTVTGMIATFQSISLFGTGDPKLMASGISQALVTTMLGLIAAIPLLFMHALVANRSKTLVQILDEQSAGLVSRIIETRK